MTLKVKTRARAVMLSLKTKKRFKTVNRWNIIRVLYECLYQKCLDFGGFSVDYGREGIAKKACSPVAA